MKKKSLILAFLGIGFGVFGQSISVNGNDYHYYGPNSTWGEYLKVGGNGRGTTKASVVSTNGNLHLDSKDGHTTYINHYSLGNTNISPNGGKVGVGTSYPRELFQVGNTYTFHDGGHKVIGFMYSAQGGVDLDGEKYSAEIRFEPATGKFRLGTSNSTTSGPLTHFILNKEGNVGIGTLSPDSKLSVNGTIRTKEVKVELTGWSDFVFYNDYKLPSLKDVEAHIKKEGHLKDIPSAEEVLENGISLGEMDSKLLQKIEELTLYTIEQEKKLKAQNEKLNKQAEEIQQLKEEKENMESMKSLILELQTRVESLEVK